MKISVVTASFNSEATIGYTIESFLKQTHADKEMLVVDGVSRDGTLKIVESFASPDIRVFSEPDKGVYDAMNKGFHRFAGDAVGFLNSDDTFHDANVLSDIAAGLADTDVVYGDLWERKGLSKRDRSLITVAALIATYRPEQLESHLTRAIGNGVTQDEITEVITHLAFYAGWPSAMSAAQLAYTVLVENQTAE